MVGLDKAEVPVVTAEDKERAEEFKGEGNTNFKNNKFETAIEFYTFAAEADPTNAVYFSNRAFCHIKLENYGTAVEDATEAIRVNKSYVKGYYRRGAAYMAMAKHKKAMADFKTVLKMKPTDKTAKAKANQCRRAIREAAFAKAIEGEQVKPPSETTDISQMAVDASYDGPRWEEGEPMSLEFVMALKEHYTSQKRLHRKYVYRILLDIIALYKQTPTLVDIDIPEGTHFTVCGDVHGQYYDVMNIFELNGMPSEENPYLFNGDYVDRGSFSLEVMVLFFAIKLLYPNHFHLARGNHESRTMNQIYGFKGEVVAKVDTPSFQLFSEAFDWLPLAHCIKKKILVVHGGLFSDDGVKLDDIRKIDRVRQPPESGLMCELMWADPQPANGRAPSKRGVGLSFGPDVTKRFCEDNGLERIIRSHEAKANGYEEAHNGQCITVFSAPNYCDTMGNKGAFIKFESDLKPKFTSFDAVPHPPVQPMAYASPMFR